MRQLYCVIFSFIAYLSSFAQNSIVTENALPGNPISEWGVPNFREERISGFSTRMSLNAGETVVFKINVEGSATYNLRIYRIGYYSGDGARLVADLGTLNGVAQPEGIEDVVTGLLDCGNWSESASWSIPAAAVSGFYIARLERTGGGSNHIAFVVRNDVGNSDMYLQIPDATWQAYNGFGGNSLYDGTTEFPSGHAVKVSYNRPFFPYNSLRNTDGREADWYMNALYPMIRWLERNGYDVSYTACNDVENNGSRLLNHKIFLSVGHDEYWSKNHRENVEAARDAGVHLAFFSGNEVYWKTRWENNEGGEDRTLVCYKEGVLGDNTMGERTCGNKCDVTSTEWTGLWRTGGDYDAGRPENSLTGQMSWVELPAEIGVPDTYKNLRFWRNTSVTGLLPGQTAFLGVNTLGYEWDYEQAQYASTYPECRFTLSSRTLNNRTHKLSLYKHSSGAWVFGAGTVQWSWGLDGQHFGGSTTVSPEMQQATVNLFADMGVQPATLQSDLVAATVTTDFTSPLSAITLPPDGTTGSVGTPITISGTATDAEGGVVASVEVSTDGGATWRPAEISSADNDITWTYTWIPESEGNKNIKSRGVDDSGNKENPAAGIQMIIGPEVCPCNIFPLQSLPLRPLDNDQQNMGIEFGTRFQASEDGFINGIRFYKGAGTTGNHVGTLWTNTGTLLATAPFTNETASGWQEVLFPSPVPITAGVTYVASTFSSSGDYASSLGYFNQPVQNGPLRGLANGEDGNNGVFIYTNTTTFPTNSHMAINYWVDVVYTKTETGRAPDISQDPSPQTVCSGAEESFSSAAGGSPIPTVQWQKSTDGSLWSDIPGATNTTLAFLATPSGNNTLYRAAWTNSEGTVFSTAALLTVTPGPAIPTVTVVNNCGNSMLTATGDGDRFTWSTGATTASITVDAPGIYTVTQSIGVCTSEPASAEAMPATPPHLISPLQASVKSGDLFQYEPESSEEGTILTWKRVAVDGISNPAAEGIGNISETLINTTSAPLQVIYEYTLKVDDCTNKQNLVVTVNPEQAGGGGEGCETSTYIVSNFNTKRITEGRYIWFNSSLRAFGLNKIPQEESLTIRIRNGRITFMVYGRTYSLPVPDSRILFTDKVTKATTEFINNEWVTTVPRDYAWSVFMGGLSFKVPYRLPGNVKNVKWSADISIDQPGIALRWRWAAAVYSKLGGHDELKVKPVSGWKYNDYPSNELAGTPENYRQYLVTGGTGNSNGQGKRNYTGDFSQKKSVYCNKKDEDQFDDDDDDEDDDDDKYDRIKPPYKSVPDKITQLPWLNPDQDASRKLEVTVNPNPSQGSFSLRIESSVQQPATVTITDNFGKVVEKHQGISTTGTYRFGDRLKTGVYFVEVIVGGQHRTVMILKL